MPTTQQKMAVLQGGKWSPNKLFAGGGLGAYLPALAGVPWVDTSGNGNAVTTAGTPDYTTVTTPNGHPAILFDGSTDYFFVNSVAPIFSGSDQPYTVAQVVRANSTVGNFGTWATGKQVGANPFVAARRAADAFDYFRRDDAATLVQSHIISVFSGADIWYSIIEVFTGTALSVWVNGNKIINAAAYDVGQMTVDRVLIGGLILGGTVSQLWPNAMSLTMFLNRAITAPEVANLQAFVLREHGVPS